MKSQYHVIVWGEGTSTSENPDIRSVNTFATQTELSDWLNRHGAMPNESDQNYLLLPDGRTCLVIRGTIKGVKKQVKLL